MDFGITNSTQSVKVRSGFAWKREIVTLRDFCCEGRVPFVITSSVSLTLARTNAIILLGLIKEVHLVSKSRSNSSKLTILAGGDIWLLKVL